MQSSALCASGASLCASGRRLPGRSRSARKVDSVRTRVAVKEVGSGTYESDEVVRPLTRAQQDVLLQSLAADLENSYAEGFTYTPFAADMKFVDPVVSLEGRTAYKLMWSPLWFAMNQMLDPESLRFELKSIEIIDGDADPLKTVAFPPKADGPSSPRVASCAVHCVWETYGTGKANFNLPEGLPFDLGGRGVLNQKEFFMSGQDVFRIDSAGRVMLHESAWDQSPEAIMSYLNPLAHIPMLEDIMPVFSNAVPKKPTPEEPVAEEVDAEVVSGEETYTGYSYPKK